MSLNGLIDITNQEYHSEIEHLSSSSLKLLITDLNKFYQEKILKIKPPTVESPHFSEGSYLHSLILEPHKVHEEYAFFDGWRKSGKEWIEFKEASAGKTILSKPQAKKVQSLYAHYIKNDLAKELVAGCEYEKSLFTEISGIKIKVRADGINLEKGYIIDVKTTSFDLDKDSFKATCDRFHYQLSAALYLKAFEDFYKKEFDFYFIVVGKEEKGCKVYKLSKDSRTVGDMQIAKAIKIFKACSAKNDWTGDSLTDNIEQKEIDEV